VNLTRVAMILVGVLVALSACERNAPPPAAAVPKEVAVIDAARFSEWLRRDRAAVAHEIAVHEFALQRRLLDFSGLTEDLGGPARADAALRELMLALEASSIPPDIAQWKQVADDDLVGGHFIMAQAANEIIGVALELPKIYGDGKTKTTGHEGEHDITEINVANGAIDFKTGKEVSASGLNGKFLTTVKINVCPDATGEIKLEIEGRASVSRADGSRGTNTEFKAVATQRLDDDANMGDLEVHANLQSAEFGGGSGSFVDMDTDLSVRKNLMGTKLNRRSSLATDQDVETVGGLLRLLELLAAGYGEFTRDIWAKGKCVKLDTQTTPGERRNVKPSTTFSVFAAPRSRLDGSFVGGTVRGTLKGEASLDPGAKKIQADATFAYVAPRDRRKEAVVNLEARSKRGIALEDLAFSTAGDAYRVEGGADEFHGTGIACDLAAQFLVEGSGVTVSFVPESPAGGRYSYTGNMSGLRVYGHGQYTVRYVDEVAVGITATGPGSVETPMGTQTRVGTEQYRMTPQDGASCDAT
jgi:hypothetical protein